MHVLCVMTLILFFKLRADVMRSTEIQNIALENG